MNKEYPLFLILVLNLNIAKADFVSPIRADQYETIFGTFILERSIKVSLHPPIDFAMVFRVKCMVQGNVEHWGHMHTHNKYSACIKVKPVENIWKMYDIETVAEARFI